MNIVHEIGKSVLAVHRLKTVYPFYVMSRIKAGIALPDLKPTDIALTPGDIQSCGNSVYALTVADDEGNKYRITVECIS